MPSEKVVVGWREWLSLPELGVDRIKAKIDTGARSSAIHAFDVVEYHRAGRHWLRFNLHPLQRSSDVIVPARARVLDRREVRSSTGHLHLRWLIRTEVVLAGQRFPIELTLSRRDEMGFRMLLGRQALRGRFVVDPGRSFVSDPRRRRARRQA
ncbi:MAG: ATP-dependent zinc protease [Planctomycetota bacterium]